MRNASLRGLFVVSSLVLTVLVPATSYASNTVNPGYDLFTTRDGTQFDFGGLFGLGLLDLEGRPLGSFDFGNGPELLPKTDTIVRRLAPATDAAPTIPIEIIELSLQSVDPVDIGNGPEFILIDLDSDAGSSQMTINGLAIEGDPHGTFDSVLNFNFVVSGSISGFLGILPTSLTNLGTPWRHAPAPGEPLIAGINHLLNGLDQLTDFWLIPGMFVVETHPGVGVHVAGPKINSGSTGQCFFGPATPAGGAGFFPDVKTPPMTTSNTIGVPWCTHHNAFVPNFAGYRFALSYDQSEIDVIHTGALPPFIGISPLGVPQPSITLFFPPLPPSASPTPVNATRTHTVWLPPPTALASGIPVATSTTFPFASFQLHARHTSLTNSDIDFAVLASPILHATTTLIGPVVSRWIPGVQTWIMTTFVSPSSFYIPKTTSWVFSGANLGLEHGVTVPALSAGALAMLVGTMMLGSSWALRRRRRGQE